MYLGPLVAAQQAPSPHCITAEGYVQNSSLKKEAVNYVTASITPRQQVLPQIGQFGHYMLIFLGLAELSAAS